ncbi:MAG TPA: hypothetical protein VLA62_11945 [Solirubrobacterales bacterium]|nr:hypothetical protein [Solirubrobacterales bacterium]
MYDWLLFLHVLSAFALVVTVVVFSAFALGMAADSRLLAVGNAAWNVGGLGTLVLGIWLALYLDNYEIWDGWIITALVLFAIATELGRRAQIGYTPAAPGEAGGATAGAPPAALMHWLRTLVILALLVVMIYKPGA